MRPDVKRDFVMISLLVAAGALGGILALQPDPSVRLEAELSRLEPEDALQELREVDGRIAFDDNLELLYGRLLLADGDLDVAQRSFLTLLKRAGPSEEVLDTLAGINATAGDLKTAASYLRQAYDIFPSPERRLRLVGWYRALRQPEAERDLLLSAPPETLTTWEIERLALLLIHDERIDEYETLISSLANSDVEDHLAFKRSLLEFLVESGRSSGAVAVASHWAQEPGAAEALDVSLRALIGRGAIDAAILVARESFRLAPQDSHVVLPIFAQSGHGGIARILQNEWLASKGTLTEAEWDTLTIVAESTGDMRGLQVALSSNLLAGAGPTSRALMQFMRYRGAQALVPYRSLMNEDVYKEAPLLGAAWSAWQGDQASTYRHLVAAGGQDQSEWDQLIWMSLLDRLKGSPFHRALLAGEAQNIGLRQRLRDSVIPARPASVTASGSADIAG
ncbi:hypothetical protein MLD63_13480 [Paracoccus sp. TK19116]|uniref:Tetratricopeptide repeat protein n=1 Tax=Paracoccus albicereus TaxID=2922394 RepID=A0ABT1MT08_9RHOB|nr:hypothetical protein [Paracoccus albicereus]MCQ0971432.1 hypothetical protein [Paracoccus albicereus]